MVHTVYIKNPEYVEAVQWTGNNYGKVSRFCLRVRKVKSKNFDSDYLAFVDSPSRIIPRGSYIVKDRDGNFRNVSFDYFKNNYRRV